MCLSIKAPSIKRAVWPLRGCSGRRGSARGGSGSGGRPGCCGRWSRGYFEREADGNQGPRRVDKEVIGKSILVVVHSFPGTHHNCILDG